jgi:ribonuclease-3
VPALDKLDAIPGYQFKDPDLLARALRHRSAGRDNNERLEFLGDAVLGFIVADFLCVSFPNATEGDLSRIRAALVQQATLAAIARELRLGDSLILGPGELKSGGAKRDSILADALEALICAIYLDGGLEQCRTLVQAWFEPRLAEHQRPEAGKDAKTRRLTKFTKSAVRNTSRNSPWLVASSCSPRRCLAPAIAASSRSRPPQKLY